MASSITVNVVKNEFGRYASRLESTASDMSEETADAIVTDARQRVPVRTGVLRDSIQARPQGIGYLVEATAPYAARIEYGFHSTDSLGRRYHQSAQPYLTPAAEAQRAPYLDRLKRALGDV